MRFFKWVLALIIVLSLGGFIFLRVAPPDLLRVATGYSAKMICSNVFIANRDPDEVLRVDVQAPGHPILKLVRFKFDESEGTVRTSLIGGIAPAVAKVRTDYGCSLVPSVDLAPFGRSKLPKGEPVADMSWSVAFDSRLDAITQNDVLLGEGMRAFVVIKDGAIVAEKYGSGFDADTPLLGWSMAKSVTAMAIGHAIGTGTLTLEQANQFPEWADDDRSEIMIADLLAMESGLEWNEGYGSVSDVTRMLYLSDDFTRIVRAQLLEEAIGDKFLYSSGTTNLAVHALQEAVGENSQAYIHNAIFVPLGMKSAIMELDAVGNLAGSSYLYANGRDWAKFGQLWLNGGRWNGVEIVPPDFIEMMATPTGPSDGSYGKGSVWIETPDKALPQGTFRFSGHDGQSVTVVPSQRLVVVRLGLTPKKLGWEVQPLVRATLAALAG